MTALNDHLRNATPRCIADVNATPSALMIGRECVATAFLLSQKGSGEAPAQILGFPLGDYNPACKGDPDFIGPLTLRWMDSSETCVFDSKIHGYHGEMDASAKYRGTGVPAAFSCSKCGKDRFSVKVQFDYWDACDDLLEDEPDLPVVDYFCNVIFAGTCVGCGATSEVLHMDL